jgi:hydrogenase maturation protein HypF
VTIITPACAHLSLPQNRASRMLAELETSLPMINSTLIAASAPADTGANQRLRVAIRGVVQGVGFRPFVYRLATGMQLCGWVINNSEGVFIEVEGSSEALHEFVLRLEREKPAIASIQSLEPSFLDPVGFASFEIRESAAGEKTALVLPDIATCPDCMADILAPANRRFRYPFTNCTNCGPRYSIIRSLPYDRPNTTMRRFALCDACREEYEDPRDRRFHAQPVACPACGPRLALWDADGQELSRNDDALLAATHAIRNGAIVAIKGIGGFHLVVDARSEAAVRRLRERKSREEKPLALMFASLAAIAGSCAVSPLEARLLASPEAPIVILDRRRDASGSIAPSVAPRNPTLGVMLPYTPLHHLLMMELGFPVVATSGNRSDEPICIDEDEAVERLRGIADVFLVHDRPIERTVDDSVARILGDREMLLRRGRGYAPLPLPIGRTTPRMLAVGAQQKSTIALSLGTQALVSQHIGDLETAEANAAFHRVIESLESIYDYVPAMIACDLHPNYMSTAYARKLGAPVFAVQHHFAHVLACMADNDLDGPVLGISWDGSGYGLDGTIWGGELLRVDRDGFSRFAHLRTFRLAGGEQAIREPRRSAIGLLHEIHGARLFERDPAGIAARFSDEERSTLNVVLEKGINAPVTSSAGRLFDAVAAIVGLRDRVAFEGQAAMELEFAIDRSAADDSRYDFNLAAGEPHVIDWEPMVREIVDDVTRGVPVPVIAVRFHNTLVEMIVAAAAMAREARVVLTGGCFQNRYLTERAVARLREEGFRPYHHQRIPPNDGGIALGQIVAAARAAEKEIR